jgi:signal transduction histidine kinase
VLLRSRKIEGWAVEYQIIDNGCGMDDETKDKIFHNFFSTKGSRGTGLGLMMTRKIIDEHNGIITFESEKGKGAKFIIKLPLEAEKRKEAQEKAC